MTSDEERNRMLSELAFEKKFFNSRYYRHRHGVLRRGITTDNLRVKIYRMLKRNNKRRFDGIV